MSSAASTRAEEAEHVLARPGSEEADPPVEPELRSAPLERRALRTVAQHQELDAGHPGERREGIAERLLRGQPPAVPERRPANPEGARASSRDGSDGSSGAGFGTTVDAPWVEPPAERDRRAGTRSGRRSCGARRSAAVRVARSSRTRSPPRTRWNSVERAVEPSRAALPLVRLVGDELDDERPPCERCAEGGTPHHRRRVDAVGRPRCARHLPRRPRDAGAARHGARETQRTGYGCGAGSASAVVTTSTSWPASRSAVASAGAWLAGPPTSGGQMPETTTTLTSSPPRERP